MGISYITRGDVLSAIGDSSPTARGTGVVDRALDSGSRAVEALCHRVFYPTSGTRSLQRASTGEHLWLDANELVSATSISVDGSTVDPLDYQVWPNTGPPYTSLRFDSDRAFTSDSVILVTGVFGACNDQIPAGALAAAITTTTQTQITVTDGSLVDVGALLTIDSERLQVTETTWVDGAQTGSLAANQAAQTLAVASGAAWHVGERLLIDSERLLVTDIAGNNLTVKRAVEGSTLAAHSTAAVYVARSATVVRGVTGTTAATHLISAPITRLQAPALVRSMSLAEAVNTVLQETGGYSREAGAGDTKRPASGGGLDSIRASTYAAHGRKGRTRSV
jgi:hypothetical protein